MPELRTSTMTHIVWCPPEWHAKARVTLAGLAERHPARTIFLIPQSGRKSEVVARAELKGFQLPGMAHEVLSEVIQIRLHGDAVHHPGSIITPLLVSDLPVFCRWRGEPIWGSGELEEILGVTDRLVVDSSEWRRPPAAYAELASLFERTAVSDIAFSRSLQWRRRLADLWPGIASITKLRGGRTAPSSLPSGAAWARAWAIAPLGCPSAGRARPVRHADGTRSRCRPSRGPGARAAGAMTIATTAPSRSSRTRRRRFAPTTRTRCST